MPMAVNVARQDREGRSGCARLAAAPMAPEMEKMMKGDMKKDAMKKVTGLRIQSWQRRPCGAVFCVRRRPGRRRRGLPPASLRSGESRTRPPAGPIARETAMDIFIQQLINGLTLGSVYALVALGYTMVYGIIGLINFCARRGRHDRRDGVAVGRSRRSSGVHAPLPSGR